MIAALKAWWRALRHLNHRGYLYIWANFFWFLLTIPIITAPAAWAGLSRLSYVAFRSHMVSLDDFWQGVRENLRRGLVLALLNAVIITINVSNLFAYQAFEGLQVTILRILWILALVIWFSLQFYLWPLFYVMEQPSLRGAFRNAAVMLLLNPVFTLTLWGGIALVLAFSTVLPVAWILLTGSVLAIAANSAVLDRLQAAGHNADMPDEIAEDMV